MRRSRLAQSVLIRHANSERPFKPVLEIGSERSGTATDEPQRPQIPRRYVLRGIQEHRENRGHYFYECRAMARDILPKHTFVEALKEDKVAPAPDAGPKPVHGKRRVIARQYPHLRVFFRESVGVCQRAGSREEIARRMRNAFGLACGAGTEVDAARVVQGDPVIERRVRNQ